MAGMRPRLVTFDVYTALLDIQGGLVLAFARALAIAPGEAAPLVRQWRAKQMELAAISNSLGLGRRPFRECTRLGLDHVLATHDVVGMHGNMCTLAMRWAVLAPRCVGDAANLYTYLGMVSGHVAPPGFVVMRLV